MGEMADTLVYVNSTVTVTPPPNNDKQDAKEAFWEGIGIASAIGAFIVIALICSLYQSIEKKREKKSDEARHARRQRLKYALSNRNKQLENDYISTPETRVAIPYPEPAHMKTPAEG
jgi:hypothetical protein